MMSPRFYWTMQSIFNAQRMREGYCSHPVCLCVCVSVCYRPSADIRRVCDKIGLPVYSSLHAKGFKLSVFAKKPSISSSSLFSLRTAERAAILKHWSCYVDFNDHYSNCQCLTTAFSEFDDHYPMQRPLPREGKYSYSTLYIRCLVAIWVGVVGVRVFEREYFLIVTYWTSVGVRVFEPEYFLIETQQDLRWSVSTSCSWVSSLRVFIQREFIRLEYLRSCTTLSQLVTPSTRPRIRNSHTITHTHTSNLLSQAKPTKSSISISCVCVHPYGKSSLCTFRPCHHVK